MVAAEALRADADGGDDSADDGLKLEAGSPNSAGDDTGVHEKMDSRT